jgi:hypothetical protein
MRFRDSLSLSDSYIDHKLYSYSGHMEGLMEGNYFHEQLFF